MLASTVQFSTYDQTPPTRPRQTHAPPQGTRRYENRTGPDREATTHPVHPGEPALSGPNSVPTNRVPHADPRSTPTRR